MLSAIIPLVIAAITIIAHAKMNKIKTVVLLIVAIVITAIATEKILIKNIKVDAVDEVDKGVVTLDINGQLYDYEYEYIEIDRSFLQ